MKKMWKDKWVKALRSGEYAQGQGSLCHQGVKHDYFCCLGVLCDIVDGNKWAGYHEGMAVYGKDEFMSLPNSVKEKTGLKDERIIGELIDMNDSGKRFSTIAKYIENSL